MTVLSKAGDERIRKLKHEYRAAFSHWVSARNVLVEPYKGPENESAAHANEVSAADIYRTARNDLTAEMLHLAGEGPAFATSGVGNIVGIEEGAMLNNIPAARGWGWDFLKIFVLVAVTVAVAAFLAGLASAPK